MFGQYIFNWSNSIVKICSKEYIKDLKTSKERNVNGRGNGLWFKKKLLDDDIILLNGNESIYTPVINVL